jgi:PAS domain S-box-containing protein
MPVSVQEPEPAYRAIFEATSDGLVINDPDTGLVLEANPAFCRMHGYDRMTGMYPAEFIHPSSHQLFEAYVQAVKEGREYRCRAKDVRRDGSVFDVEVLGRGFQYQDRFAMLGVVRDATEQVQAYEVLEQRIAERTHEIQRRQQVAEALAELLAVVNAKQPLEAIVDVVLVQAGRLLGSNAEALHLIDERDPSVLRLAASRNLPHRSRRQPRRTGCPSPGWPRSAGASSSCRT